MFWIFLLIKKNHHYNNNSRKNVVLSESAVSQLTGDSRGQFHKESGEGSLYRHVLVFCHFLLTIFYIPRGWTITSFCTLSLRLPLWLVDNLGYKITILLGSKKKSLLKIVLKRLIDHRISRSNSLDFVGQIKGFM